MNKDTNTYSAAGEVGSVLESRSTFTRLKIELNKAPLTAKFGIFIIIVFVGLAIFAPLIAPYGEAEVFPEPYAPWSANHIFGTDQIGRDIFSRLIFGARNTVGVAFATQPHPGPPWSFLLSHFHSLGSSLGCRLVKLLPSPSNSIKFGLSGFADG